MWLESNGLFSSNQLAEGHFCVTVLSQNLRRKNYPAAKRRQDGLTEFFTHFFAPATESLTRIVQSGGDAIDRGAQRIIQFLRVIP